ncbi:hypothetical protein [Gracilibacillus xinjiangensis]|uniref:Uncharacterized protein n=1 Tax=Gracilibacillus xinjiangensis TaxID=1193282 RepID=A0ABV8WTK6_9BACI
MDTTKYIRQALAHQDFRAVGYEDLVTLLKQVNFDYLKKIKINVISRFLGAEKQSFTSVSNSSK